MQCMIYWPTPTNTKQPVFFVNDLIYDLEGVLVPEAPQEIPEGFTHHDMIYPEKGLEDADLDKMQRRAERLALRTFCANTRPCSELVAAMGRLARSSTSLWVFTNATRQFAHAVLDHVGLDSLTGDNLVTVEEIGNVPKNDPEAFHAFTQITGVNLGNAVMFEDQRCNLAAAARAGVAGTVLVDAVDEDSRFDHTITRDGLPDFLTTLMKHHGFGGPHSNNDGFISP